MYAHYIIKESQIKFMPARSANVVNPMVTTEYSCGLAKTPNLMRSNSIRIPLDHATVLQSRL